MDELSPRQIQFLKFWIDPKEKETFGNAYQSALKAGYSEDYAKVLASRDLEWLSENVKRKYRIVEKAETNLEDLLDEEDKKVKADMTKFALSRLKKEDYSDRTELTGKNGGAIETKKEVSDEEFDSLMAGYARRKEGTGAEKVV